MTAHLEGRFLPCWKSRWRFHREQAAAHEAQEAYHREQRARHAASLARASRRLASAKAAPASRAVSHLVARVVDAWPSGTPFGTESGRPSRHFATPKVVLPGRRAAQ